MFDDQVYLYVEDDPLSREVLSGIMKMAMHVQHLTIFEDSTDFLQRLKTLQPRPTIIILDIQLKPHDGFELLRMVRTEPDYRDAKVIALTASVMNEEVDQLKMAGFDGAIGKPLDVLTFPPIMEQILRGEVVWHVA